MCIVVYLSSSKPLPTSEWKQGDGVAITALPSHSPADVQKQFSYPYVYYVASSDGCGCGFLTDFKEDDEKELARGERRALSEITKRFLTTGASLQLLIAYSGYEMEEIDTRITLPPDGLVDCEFDKAWDYEVILVGLTEFGPITKPSM